MSSTLRILAPAIVVIAAATSLRAQTVHTGMLESSDPVIEDGAQADRPKVYASHPVMTPDEIRARTQAVWDLILQSPPCVGALPVHADARARLAFVLISKLYRQMYANTGIATDSARVNRANRWARLIARPCRRLFIARPLPGLPSA